MGSKSKFPHLRMSLLEGGRKRAGIGTMQVPVRVFWGLLICLFVLGVCVVQGAAPPSGSIPVGAVAKAQAPVVELVKSKSDLRSYRYVTLPNGMSVLLVQDSRSAMASACVDVGNGWWHDPDDLPGLAHFVEHMLFLGNKKYPREGAWRQYLASHGGTSNAYTSALNTNFYFLVSAAGLRGALERFSWFFHAPLFSRSGTGREIKAVHAENMKNLQNDGWREMMLLQTMVNESLPYHHFSTGNLATLGSITPDQLHHRLHRMFDTYYYAANMRLVVMGNQALDELEMWARESFSKLRAAPVHQAPPIPGGGRTAAPVKAHVKHGNASVATLSGPVAPMRWSYKDIHQHVFPAAVKGAILYAQTVKSTRSMMIIWSLPPQLPHYKLKALEYISNIVGSESPGSLSALLKQEGLISGITAGRRTATPGFDVWQIKLSLTEQGCSDEGAHRAMERTYRFLHMLETEGIEEWRWKEMGTISAIQYRLKGKEAMMHYSSRLGADLAKYPPRDVLIASSEWETFDKDVIVGLLNHMRPETAVTMLAMKEPLVNLTHKEKYYGTMYAVRKISAAHMKQLVVGRRGSSHDHATERFHLPGPNKFIPSSFAIKPSVLHGGEHPWLIVNEYAGLPASKPDEKRVLNQSTRVWFRQSEYFKRPRANVACKFWGKTYRSPRDMVLATFYSNLVRDYLLEVNYQALRAGYTFSITADIDGLNLRAAGYDSGLVTFLKSFADRLVLKFPLDSEDTPGFVPAQSRFNRIFNTMMSGYDNFLFSQPHQQGSYNMFMLTEEPHWYVQQYREALRSIKLEDVIMFSKEYYTDTALECLVVGNVYSHEAEDIINVLRNNVPYTSVSTSNWAVSRQTMRIAQVPGTYTFTGKTHNKEDANSAAFVYHQYTGQGNIDDDVMIQLLAGMMSKPCFHQLRTIEQLGYLVWSGTFNLEGVNGIRVVVQSPKKSAAYLNSRITRFLSVTMRNIVYKMTRQMFHAIVMGAIRFKLQTSPTLAGQTSRYWSEIQSQQYRFQRKHDEIYALRGLTLEMFRQFYDGLIEPKTEKNTEFVANRINVLIEAQTQGPDINKLPEAGTAKATSTSSASAGTSHGAGVTLDQDEATDSNKDMDTATGDSDMSTDVDRERQHSRLEDLPSDFELPVMTGGDRGHDVVSERFMEVPNELHSDIDFSELGMAHIVRMRAALSQPLPALLEVETIETTDVRVRHNHGSAGQEIMAPVEAVFHPVSKTCGCSSPPCQCPSTGTIEVTAVANHSSATTIVVPTPDGKFIRVHVPAETAGELSAERQAEAEAAKLPQPGAAETQLKPRQLHNTTITSTTPTKADPEPMLTGITPGGMCDADNGGIPKVHDPVELTYEAIQEFKSRTCLFPKRIPNQKVPTKALLDMVTKMQKLKLKKLHRK